MIYWQYCFFIMPFIWLSSRSMYNSCDNILLLHPLSNSTVMFLDDCSVLSICVTCIQCLQYVQCLVIIIMYTFNIIIFIVLWWLVKWFLLYCGINISVSVSQCQSVLIDKACRFAPIVHWVYVFICNNFSSPRGTVGNKGSWWKSTC